MDRNKAIELIKARTLGCLTKDEDAEFKEYMENGEDFPWDVLGEYQNLAAMLPILLPLELPDSELKDNVARKLYKVLEELKAKKQAELTPVADTDPEPTEADTEIETEKELEEVLTEEPIKFSLEDGSTLSDSDLSSELSDDSSLDSAPAEPIVEEKSGKEKVEKIVDEKLERQRTMEYIQSYYKEEAASQEGAIKKAKLFSIILFVVSLIVLAVVYFLLSSEISSNKEEIDNLKIGFDESLTILQDDNLV
ncbi:MAG: hypothetical protein HKM87_08635 [Ignavibacteriaceae bacterium]|nr:hypothetical protein [Ignavibacteriaceae bacterium]